MNPSLPSKKCLFDEFVLIDLILEILYDIILLHGDVFGFAMANKTLCACTGSAVKNARL